MSKLDPEDPDRIAGIFGISCALAQEIVWVNDEAAPWNNGQGETPEGRFERVRRWAETWLKAGPL